MTKEKTPKKTRTGKSSVPAAKPGLKIEQGLQGELTKMDVKDLVPFQEGLKTLTGAEYEKLREVLITLGISAPFYYWRKGKQAMLLDGHQRREALLKMREEGFKIPPVPVVEVKAADEREAAGKALALASTFGSVDVEGLEGFLELAGMSLKDAAEKFSFPDLQMPAPAIQRLSKGEGAQDLDLEQLAGVLTHRCPECSFRF